MAIVHKFYTVSVVRNVKNIHLKLFHFILDAHPLEIILRDHPEEAKQVGFLTTCISRALME